jgi:hypothetical protein
LHRLEDRVPSLYRVEPDDDDIDVQLTTSAGQLRVLGLRSARIAFRAVKLLAGPVRTV